MLIYRFIFGALYISANKYYKGEPRLMVVRDTLFLANIFHSMVAIIIIDDLSSSFLWNHLLSTGSIFSKILWGIIILIPVIPVHFFIDKKLSYKDIVRYKKTMERVGNINIISCLISFFYINIPFIIIVVYLILVK